MTVIDIKSYNIKKAVHQATTQLTSMYNRKNTKFKRETATQLAKHPEIHLGAQLLQPRLEDCEAKVSYVSTKLQNNTNIEIESSAKLD